MASANFLNLQSAPMTINAQAPGQEPLPESVHVPLPADFRLTRLILIDSYARGKTVEIDLSGHTALTGENASGKTTLLRLFPLFFGESPSRVIQSDSNNHKFGKHYFHSLGSYIVYEYERRGRRVLAVIQPNGQSDNILYRFIESDYRPELFRNGTQSVDSSDLTRHLLKLGVEHTKPMSLSAYRQIIQNEAGRDNRRFANSYAYTGSGNRLKHMERIVSNILQRATTFYDLKRMIVSAIQESQQEFSMRTSKRELLHWIAEFDAHNAIMEMAPVMDELELADQQRREIENEFSRLHASFQLMHDYFEKMVLAGEAEEKQLSLARADKVKRYGEQSLSLMEKVNAQKALHKTETDTLTTLDARHAGYEKDKAPARASAVDALPEMGTRQTRLKTQLEALEASSKSVTEFFDKLDAEAKADAEKATRELEARRSKLVSENSAAQGQLYEAQAVEQREQAARHKKEHYTQSQTVAGFRTEEARLMVEAGNPQPEAAVQQAFGAEEQAFQEAGASVDKLRADLVPLESALGKANQAFRDCEDSHNASITAAENAGTQLQDLIAAENAGTDTLLGFLRTNKPDWASDIGRLVPEKILMRTDLLPTLGEGNDLYGISIDLERLESSRLSSEESIQAEIKRLRQLCDKRQGEVEEDQRRLNEAGRKRQSAKDARDAQLLKIGQAESAKASAQQRLQTARKRLVDSRNAAREMAESALAQCRAWMNEAKRALENLDARHASEDRLQLERHQGALAGMKLAHETALNAIAADVTAIAATLATRRQEIAAQRDQALKDNGVDIGVLTPIREELESIGGQIKVATDDRGYVATYRDWLEHSWSKRAQHEADRDAAKRAQEAREEEHRELIRTRDQDLEAHDKDTKRVQDQNDRHARSQRMAKAQMRDHLARWMPDRSTLEAGYDDRISIELLAGRRGELQATYGDLLKRIGEDVNAICRQMASVVGTGPERYYTNAAKQIGALQIGREYLWIEGLRGWFSHEHKDNRSNLIQLGKTFAQGISAFFTGLSGFKKEVGNFANRLKPHLLQGQVFNNISDVSVIIGTEVDKQGYWQAVQSLHNEYDAWHVLGDALPPPAFIAAAREVATVLHDDKGLIADPVDLITLQITANIDGDGTKVANNEAALVRMSSNGLSYLILCVVMIGFINSIRGKEKIVIPFVVDELKDLSVGNATALLNLLAQNNINIVSAFPDVDPDLAPLFNKNYKILPGRMLATVKLEAEDAYV